MLDHSDEVLKEESYPKVISGIGLRSVRDSIIRLNKVLIFLFLFSSQLLLRSFSNCSSFTFLYCGQYFL